MNVHFKDEVALIVHQELIFASCFQAKAVLDTLPEDKGDDSDALVTSAA